MFAVLIVGILSVLLGYSVYLESVEMFTAATIGFIAMVININVKASRILDILSFVTVFGAIGYGSHLFYLNSFLGA